MNVRAEIDIGRMLNPSWTRSNKIIKTKMAYFFAANDTPILITRTRTISDNTTLSGSGTLVGALARLYYLAGVERYQALADNIVRTFAGEPTRNFFPLSTLINSSELLRRGQQIVIIGDRDDAETQSLVDCVYNRSLPDRILNVVAIPDNLPEGHPAERQEKLDARTTAYVCEGPVCSLHVNTAAGLTALLQEDP